MEVKTPNPTPLTLQQRILKPPKTIHMPLSKPISVSSIQIHIPLRRPQHKPIEETPKRPCDYEPSNRSTVSDVLRLLDCLRIPVSLDLYASFIEECTKTGDPLLAIELHNHIKTSCLRPSLSVFNRLLLMYVSCHLIEYARKLFDKMTVRSSCTWAVMLAGYLENGDYGEVIDLFSGMRSCRRTKYEGCDMDDIVVSAIVVCVLKACAKTTNVELGKQVHAWILKMGYGENRVFSGSLMSFYGKVGCRDSSDSVFDWVQRNKVIWTSKIVNHCYEEQFDEAFDAFKQMGREGAKKNSYTFSSILKACASMKDGGNCGRQVHANVVKLGLELHEHVHCGLIDMYGKSGLVKDALKVFQISGDNSNVASWNAMLAGCIQEGFAIDACKILYDMKAAGLRPHESLLNEVRFICGSSLIDNRKSQTYLPE